MAWAYNHRQGLKAVMLTRTIPHKAWHTVADLLERQKAALHHLRNGRVGKSLREQMGHAGMIRALELTHGANGWHPHTHELHFLADDADAKLFKAKILALWEAACVKAGLLDPADATQVRTFRRRAVDVRDRVSRGDYLAKLADAMPEGPEKAKTLAQWGADNELASATSKQGRAKGRSIMQLLYAAADGDKKAGAGPDDVAAAICAWIEDEGERGRTRAAPKGENE